MTAFAVFSNLFFLGGEFIPLLPDSNWSYLLTPIWSLSLELYFYLLAPFIVRIRLRYLLLLVLGRLRFRLGLYAMGVPILPLRYFMFPSDFVFFMMGIMSYRLFARIEGSRARLVFGSLAAFSLLGFTIYEPFWRYPDFDQWQC